MLLTPYEEPAYDFTAIEQVRDDVGLGRVETVPAICLAEFAEVVAAALPATPTGVRFAGDRTGGSRPWPSSAAGASELASASAVADVLVTSDLKHHVVTGTLRPVGVL